MSILWKHFTDEGCEKVRCNYCNVIVSYKKGNRSIMRKHLERKHPETLGITTQAMAIDFASNFYESVTLISDIHPLFQIESNIQYFIQMIYERPTLYEYSRLVGWNSKQNKIIWQEIADTFQVDIIECQKFWKYLKETYDLHNRNPKLDDHKYAKELSFLGDMYKKRRQRKEELAKQRKLLKTFDNLEENINSNNDTNVLINFSKSEKQHDESIYENHSLRDHSVESVENYEIYEYQDTSSLQTQLNNNNFTEYNDHRCTTNSTEHKYNINEDHQYTIEYENQYKMPNGQQCTSEDNESEFIKKLKVEDIVVFDSSNSSFFDKADIVNLVNESTQTNHTGPIYNFSNHINEEKTKPLSNCKKCLNDFDELDLLMEFIKGKIRKLPSKDINELQIKILKTVMETENDSKKKIEKYLMKIN